MKFHHELKIDCRWGDMDAYGHVNNTVFFRYFESARFAYVEEYCLPVLGSEHMPTVVLADIQCRFTAQIVYPASLRVKSKITRIGNSSFDVYAEIWNGETRCAHSKAVMVWFDLQSERPVRIPAAVVQAVRELEDL